MKTRSDSILVYKDIEDDILHCRIGICNGSVSCHSICNLVRRHICCVFGNNNVMHTERFHFDNTKHKIVLSTNICKLCDDDCVEGLNKISSCRHNIKKYIDAFVEKIDSVEARK